MEVNILQDFNKNQIYIKWRNGDDLDPYVEIDEVQTIINNRLVLTEIPYSFMHVYIDGMSEIYDPKEIDEETYYVNYRNGIVEFKGKSDGEKVSVKYHGRGMILYPANRIYVHDIGDNIFMSLQEIVDSKNSAVETIVELADIRSGYDVVKDDVETLIEYAEGILDTAIEQGNVAELKGQTAELQGNKAEDQGNIAESQGSLAETRGSTAQSRGEYARNQGDYAKDQGDYAKSQIENIESIVNDSESSANDYTDSQISTLEGTLNGHIDWIGNDISQVNDKISQANDKISESDGKISDLESKTGYGSRLIETLYYNSSGVFKKEDYEYIDFVKVTVVGGGGSGGGAKQTGTGQHSEGSGGGGGGTSIKIIKESDLNSSENITVGSGGTPSSNAEDGNSGGSSFFGSHCNGNGGQGGKSGDPTSDILFGERSYGGSASGGDINIQGGDGSPSACIPNALRSNFGGSSFMSQSVSSSDSFTTGRAGRGYGGGSTGARCDGASNLRNSLSGSDGIVIVEVYG